VIEYHDSLLVYLCVKSLNKSLYGSASVYCAKADRRNDMLQNRKFMIGIHPDWSSKTI